MNVITVTPGMSSLLLGKQGENKSTKFLFDVTEWLEEYPGCSIGLNYRPAKTDVSYPCILTDENYGKKGWLITSSELVNDGDGEAELVCILDEVVEKDKRTWKTKVNKSLGGSGTAPDPWENWEDTFIELAERAEDAAEDAEEAKEAAEEAAGVAAHAPIIQDGYWYTWDATTEQYVNSGTKAQGEDGDPGQPGTDATPDLITKDYSELTFPVAEGKLCYHSGLLYKANQAIATSEEWTAAHWTQTTIETEITKTRKVYNTVADMLDDETLTAGINVATKGYYAVGDNGHNEYAISATHTGVFYLTLDNGLYANLITEEGVLRAESIGMKAYAAETENPDNDDMDRNVTLFNAAIYNGIYLLLGKGWYYFSDKVLLAKKGTYTIRGIAREITHLVFPNSDGLYFSDVRYYNYYVIRGLYIKSYGHCISCSESCASVLDSHFEWLYLISENGDGFHAPNYNMAKYTSQGGLTIYDTCVQNCVFDFINVQAKNGAGIANVMGMYSTYKHFNFVSCKYAFRNCDGTLIQANTLSDTHGLYEDYFIYYDKTYSHSLKWMLINVNAESIGKAFIYTEPKVNLEPGEDNKKPENANIMTLSSLTAINSTWSLASSVENHDVYPITVQIINSISLSNSDNIISPNAYPSKYDTNSVKGVLKSTEGTMPIRYIGGPDILCVAANSLVYTFYGELTNRAAIPANEGHGESGRDVPVRYNQIFSNQIYGGKATHKWDVKVSEYNSSILNPSDSKYLFADVIVINNDTANKKNFSAIFTNDVTLPGRIITIANSQSSISNVQLTSYLEAGANNGGFAFDQSLILKPKECVHLISTFFEYNSNIRMEWEIIDLHKTYATDVTVSGTTPTITGEEGMRYFCGEVTTLEINPPNSGVIEVYFTSGSTAAEVTLPRAVCIPAGFDPSNLSTDTKYMIRITNGAYAEVQTFVEQPYVNLFDPSTFTDGKVWYNGNQASGYSGYSASPKVAVTPGETYILLRQGGNQKTVCWFDENETYLSQESWSNNTTKTIATGVHYVGITVTTDEKNSAVFAEV